jgi:hypothetical protein
MASKSLKTPSLFKIGYVLEIYNDKNFLFVGHVITIYLDGRHYADLSWQAGQTPLPEIFIN